MPCGAAAASAADHGAVRSPDDRIRARRPASRPAVRGLPPQCHLQGHAARTAAPATSPARPSMRRRKRPRTSRPRIVARPATTRTHSDRTCISITPRCSAAASAAITARLPREKGRPIPPPARIARPATRVISWNPTKAVDHTQIPLAAAGLLHHLPQRRAGRRQARGPRGHQSRMRRLPPDDHAGSAPRSITRASAPAAASCHNGTKAVGKQGNHMPTSNLCENCHTTGIGTKTPSWVPSHIRPHADDGEHLPNLSQRDGQDLAPGSSRASPPITCRRFPPRSTAACATATIRAAETWTVLAASIATLHTGLPVSNCLLCHAGRDLRGRAGAVHSDVGQRRLTDQENAARAAAYSRSSREPIAAPATAQRTRRAASARRRP